MEVVRSRGECRRYRAARVHQARGQPRAVPLPGRVHELALSTRDQLRAGLATRPATPRSRGIAGGRTRPRCLTDRGSHLSRAVARAARRAGRRHEGDRAAGARGRPEPRRSRRDPRRLGIHGFLAPAHHPQGVVEARSLVEQRRMKDSFAEKLEELQAPAPDARARAAARRAALEEFARVQGAVAEAGSSSDPPKARKGSWPWLRLSRDNNGSPRMKMVVSRAMLGGVASVGVAAFAIAVLWPMFRNSPQLQSVRPLAAVESRIDLQR